MDYSRLDSKQRAGFFFHNKSSISLFSKTEIVCFVFQLIYVQRIDMNDMFSDIHVLRESDVESSRSDQTRLDSVSESKK